MCIRDSNGGASCANPVTRVSSGHAPTAPSLYSGAGPRERWEAGSDGQLWPIKALEPGQAKGAVRCGAVRRGAARCGAVRRGA
eukprot:4936019-Alexandrium_andersonii.AAC.1